MWIVLQNNPSIHTKTSKKQVKTKVILPLWKEKETDGKEPVCIKSEVDDNLQIQAQTDKEAGIKHDYKVYKDTHPDIPEDVLSMFDPGFFGVEKDYPQQKSSLSFKKEKKCKLTVQQKEYNKEHFKRRIAIEHTICKIKKVQNNMNETLETR